MSISLNKLGRQWPLNLGDIFAASLPFLHVNLVLKSTVLVGLPTIALIIVHLRLLVWFARQLGCGSLVDLLAGWCCRLTELDGLIGSVSST